MSIHNSTTYNIITSSWLKIFQFESNQARFPLLSLEKINLLSTISQWLNNFNIPDPVVAHRICTLIPAQCPFAREVKLFGHTLLRVPPLCKLNPLYNEVIALRFRALCYLADECGEDISSYC